MPLDLSGDDKAALTELLRGTIATTDPFPLPPRNDVRDDRSAPSRRYRAAFSPALRLDAISDSAPIMASGAVAPARVWRGSSATS
jgi:hypothetical protein